MLRQQGVAASNIETHLHITAGNVLNPNDVKSTLSINNRAVDIIISGIGISTIAELRQETSLCENAVSNILSALKELQPAKKPLLIVISTTGITRAPTPRDLPLLMIPLYALLTHPHQDKIRMEALIEKHYASSECAISGYILPRPSLLMDGTAKGGENVRVGVEERPAVGYTINRGDVGLWMFRNLFEGDGAEKYRNGKPSLTY